MLVRTVSLANRALSVVVPADVAEMPNIQLSPGGERSRALDHTHTLGRASSLLKMPSVLISPTKELSRFNKLSSAASLPSVLVTPAKDPSRLDRQLAHLKLSRSAMNSPKRSASLSPW